MSADIAHTGGDCPGNPLTIVTPTYRGPANEAKGIRIGWPVRAARLDWSHDGSDDDIVSYRISEVSVA
jgi:hypothetical protein